MFGAGVGAWAYAKLSRSVGAGNQRNAFIGGAIAGLVVFIFFFTLFKYVLNI
jgi:hypothetical protein